MPCVPLAGVRRRLRRRRERHSGFAGDHEVACLGDCLQSCALIPIGAEQYIRYKLAAE